MYHFIYKTTNLITSKFYIGMHSTNKIADGYLGSGKILQYSIAKYGKENHQREIIKMADDRESLILMEIELINKELLSNPLCMNLKYGGIGSGPGESNHFIGKTHKEETKKKISEAGRKLVHTEEAKRKISEAGKKHIQSLETKLKKSLACKGKKQNHSQESIEKREAAKCRQIELNGLRYSSIKEASFALGVNRGKIYKLLKEEQIND